METVTLSVFDAILGAHPLSDVGTATVFYTFLYLSSPKKCPFLYIVFALLLWVVRPGLPHGDRLRKERRVNGGAAPYYAIPYYSNGLRRPPARLD